MNDTRPPGKCSNGNCVDVKVDGRNYVFTSTTPGNQGSVSYTRDEVAQFLGDVKAGHWDHLTA